RGELHIVLPVSEEEFLARSVINQGESWRTRYDSCKKAAASFQIIARTDDLADDQMFAYGSSYAMGLVITRARQLRAMPIQLAVWDGAPAQGGAGTGIDAKAWRGLG